MLRYLHVSIVHSSLFCVHNVPTRVQLLLNEIELSKMFQIHWEERILFNANFGVLHRIHEFRRAD